MYFPPIPTRIFLSGDISRAQGYISLGRKVLFELKRDSDWNNIPTGQRETVLADKTRIFVRFRFGLSNIDIHVPRGDISKPEPVCECCVDCLLIGKIASNTTIVDDTRIANVEMCQTDEAYIAFENIPIIDANTNLKAGDTVIVYATPVLKETGTLTYDTNLRSVQEFRPGRVWQFYDCMATDNAGNPEPDENGDPDPSKDLTGVGLDNQAYTVSGDSCGVAGKSVITAPDNDPPLAVPVRFFITSIKTGKCLVL